MRELRVPLEKDRLERSVGAARGAPVMTCVAHGPSPRERTIKKWRTNFSSADVLPNFTFALLYKNPKSKITEIQSTKILTPEVQAHSKPMYKILKYNKIRNKNTENRSTKMLKLKVQVHLKSKYKYRSTKKSRSTKPYVQNPKYKNTHTRNTSALNCEVQKFPKYEILIRSTKFTEIRKYKHTQIRNTTTLKPKVQTYYFWKYKKSKPINKGSSCEDLDAKSTKVKTVTNLDKRFSRYFILNIRFLKNKSEKR